MNRRTLLVHWLRRLPVLRIPLLRAMLYLVPLCLQGLDSIDRKHTEQLLFRSIEATGEVRYARDVSGNVTGLAIQLDGPASAGASASGTL